jgi:hypothetical protein
VIDLLQRPVRPIYGKGQIDGALVLLQNTPDPRNIGLLHLPPFELQAEVALRMGCEGEDHHTGCIPIQPVHEKSLGKRSLHSAQEAIREMRTLARN